MNDAAQPDEERELKSCPFCGSSDVAFRDTDDNGLLVGCGGCGASSIAVYGEKDRSVIVGRWNSRLAGGKQDVSE